jgi:hypothetical protein
MMVVVTEDALVLLPLVPPVDATAGLWISPADTDRASVRPRIVAAHTWRKVFIWLLLKMGYKNFVSTLEQP